ncbi:MAG: hypothetical protein ACFFCS_07250 [Candidatus Hodarchaeota archaeon]
MNSINLRPEMPEWPDIKMITKDLTYALDTIESDKEDTLNLRINIARAIASMRAEKKVDTTIRTISRKLDFRKQEAIRQLVYYTEPPVLEVI